MGRFREDIARHFFIEFMNGLDHVHQHKIVHRDIKLDNVMLDSKYCLKICDFGLSGPFAGKPKYGDGLLGTFYGTKEYMAPEILRRSTYIGQAIDVFSSGVLLF